MAYKIEVIVRVVNEHGDVVDLQGRPSMVPSQHVVVRTYPVLFQTAAAAYKESTPA